MEKFIKKNAGWIIIATMLFVALVSILNAKNDSLIYDEDAHIPAAYSYLNNHDIRLNPEHPPMLKDFAAIPLLFLKPNFDTTQPFWDKNPDAAQWEAGKVFLFESGNDPDQIIFWARIPFILLSILLGLFIFKWTRELAGLHAGLLALILYAFDPNILGHNHFVATDLGIAAFTTFALYYFLKFIKHPSWKNMSVGGIFLGLVQLAKFSSVVMFPVLGLVLVIYPLLKVKKDSDEGLLKFKLKTLGNYLGKGLIAFAISLVLISVVYYANTYKMPKEKLPEIMSYYMHPDDPNVKTIYTRKVILGMNEIPALRPMADYTFGVARVFQRVAGGNVTYFMGEISTKGFLSYFPIIFLIKEPIPTLLLIFFVLAIGLAGFFRFLFKKNQSLAKKISSGTAHYIRTNIASFSMLIFIALYVVTSITGRLNIGFRHLFPILPFIYILVAKNTINFIKHRTSHHSKLIFNYALAVVIIFLLIENFLAYPFYMSYFNESVGGTKNGYQFATDSNADWGQDLKRLNGWIDKYNSCTGMMCESITGIGCPSYCQSIASPAPVASQPIQKIKVDYFGTADIKYYIGDKYDMWWAAKRPIEPGWYAISVEFLQQGIYDQTKTDSESYRWLISKKPAYQVGTSILIYHISPEDIANIPKKFQ